jgi:hypothetical protein
MSFDPNPDPELLRQQSHDAVARVETELEILKARLLVERMTDTGSDAIVPLTQLPIDEALSSRQEIPPLE